MTINQWRINETRNKGGNEMKCDKFITIRVKGYAGPGWEIECTGPSQWVEKTIKDYIPRVKEIAFNVAGESK